MKKILIAISLLLALLVAGGFFLSTEYDIETSVAINAPVETIHSFVGDLEKWPEWTPWSTQDPTIVVTYGEKTTGVGASQSWAGDSGDGELTFTASDPVKGIAYDMAFIQGETRAPSTCAMIYTTNGDTTTVSWTMQGDVADFMPPIISGYVALMLKGSIVAMFDLGLEELKAKAEAQG